MASSDEIWLADFGDPYPGEPSAVRPALIFAPSSIYGSDLPWVFVVPLTTTRRELAFHVEIEASPRNGLSETCYAQCEALRSVGRGRLLHRIGIIDFVGSAEIRTVVRNLLDF